ncbi:putative amidohydrolase [Lyophyllum shimeji]|uniref:6-methylsalicylate decarboxylase n=1 Tax=Lyophyllum shimeji TaxID=47721 RepID=A0A9P3PDK4_LYOSH|nr:putative amidohydrolase [Lyophyllum shimeji]
MLCIDVHHHFFPTDLKKESSNQKLGWKAVPGTLPWSPEVSLKAMDASGIDVAILSLPALNAGSVSDENRATARQRNLAMAAIARAHPTRFGFFACVPFLDDIKGVLEEVAYSLGVLQADGISLSSCYGEGMLATYIGDDRYDEVWAELHRRKAVVFLHGAQVASSTRIPHPSLCIPISEVPNETFKAAAHLVVTGRKRKYPDVKIILAHLGGTTPFLAPRVAVLSNHMGSPLTPEEMLEDFKSFYYDTALSAYDASLACIDNFVGHDRILFGTDFPAVGAQMAQWYTNHVRRHYESDSDKLNMVLGGTARKLFPRLRSPVYRT